MSTPQTDAHNELQESIRDTFVSLVGECPGSDWSDAEQYLLDLQAYEWTDNKTLIWCEDHLNEVKREVEENTIEDYKTVLNMHK